MVTWFLVNCWVYYVSNWGYTTIVNGVHKPTCICYGEVVIQGEHQGFHWGKLGFTMKNNDLTSLKCERWGFNLRDDYFGFIWEYMQTHGDL